ncbi:hypothetical protein [Streptomyces yaizuensis]|uniref:Uncharacterized protein n=1 Tax=Streptomyces yaizuensis TaxID=2989713 RepID=A0ABQ5NTA0_9ACTN|nr:hypothetical protein [Streptomyces sp. YSPA8]GLF93603.1 hypothetical protein SYYSPA8_04920 [Streptomyces sp. YSPA8]
MSNAPVNPAEIPVFTGDLAALDGHVRKLSGDGAKVVTAAGDVHTSFGGLSAFYRAPEAEQLFATTRPVTETASAISSDTCVIAGALGTYANEVRPLIAKFESLRADAAAFREKVSDDDKWREDGDLIEENLDRRNEVAEVWAQFQEAERNCHNSIVALFCGSRLTVQDGSGGANQYGYDAEALKSAKSLPWGDAVEESVPAWQVWEHAYDFGKGVIVDGVWGTIKGLGTLVGFSGWDAAGQAWTGLGKLATGVVITAIPVAGAAFWMADEKKMPAWLRDSRTAMKETGKALVAWDQWGSNPSRAAGAVTFNVVTTVFTGGAGGAAAGAGKAGAVGKVLSVVGKTGRAIDPTTYIFKGAGAGLSKAGDVLTGLKGLGNLKIPTIPDGAFSVPAGTVRLPDGTFRFPDSADLPPGATRTPEGTVRFPSDTVVLPPGTAKLPFEDGPARYMDESGNLYREDGTLFQRGDEATKENPPSTADRPRVETPSPTREPALAGAPARTPDEPVRVGSDLTDPRVPALPNTVGDVVEGAPGGGANHLPGGGAGNNLPTGSVSDNLPGGAANTPPMASVGDNVPGGAANNVPSNSLDNTTPGGGGGSTPEPSGGRGTTDNTPGGGAPGDGGPGGGGPHRGDHTPASGSSGTSAGDHVPPQTVPDHAGGERGSQVWDRPQESPEPFQRGGAEEQALRDQVRGTKVKPGDVEAIIRTLSDHPAGREIAEAIISGRFRESDGFSTVVSNLSRPTDVSGSLEQIRLANRLHDQGITDISFEVKQAGNEIKPGVFTAAKTDLDVMARTADGEVHGWQFKDMTGPDSTTSANTVVSKIFKSIKQLTDSSADVQTFVVDTKVSRIEMLEHLGRLQKGYEGMEVQFVIRTPDGIVFVPVGGRFTPEGTE